MTEENKTEKAAGGEADNADVPREEALEELSPEAASKAESEALKAEIDKLNHDLLLQRADFENMRKRLERQKLEDVKYAPLPMVRELVTVIDTMELALTHAKEDDPMRQGVAMVLDGFLKTMERFGVRRIEAAGKPFDPKEHEAMGMLCDESRPDGMVLAVARPGYLLHERLVRPAGVMVNRLPHPAEGQADALPPPE